MNFVLPPKSQVGVLDPEIAGEGVKIIHSDGDQVTWSPPPPKPVMPDWSGIKQLARYFNRHGHVVWPAWLYHPNGESRLLKNAHEAAELGVCYRDATADEKARYGLKHVWDWKDDSEWRPTPFVAQTKFDPGQPGYGKTVIASTPNPVVAQHALIEALIPTVTAAVVAALKGGDAPSAPAHVNSRDWAEFQEFMAFKKSQEVVTKVAKEIIPSEELGETPALHGDERAAWMAEANRKGIKVDGRWSLDRLKAEIEKAA